MLLLGLGALIGAWELNLQTKELHDTWMNANNIIAELDYLTSEVRLKQYAHVISSTIDEIILTLCFTGNGQFILCH